MADSGSCQPDLHSKELCADPLDRQMGNEEPRLQLGDWKAAYCRLKEEGDDEIIGEDEREREWCWQNDGEHNRNPTTQLSASGSKVLFHPTYSSGTAFVLGSHPLAPPHNHFWEVTVDSPVYGTDVMVGVATGAAPLASGQRSYCSLLGREAESWGWSYQGYTQHGGRQQKYGSKWGQGDRLGVHFDAWRGTLEFYLNRKPLGCAFTNLKNKTVYPVICSTAAKSSLTLSTARSLPSSLQFLAVRCLAHKLPGSTLLTLLLPPGIRNFIRNNYWFFIDHSQVQKHTFAPVTPSITSSGCMRMVATEKLKKMEGDETETEDEDCFLVTPEGRREAKEALLAKSVAQGEQNKRQLCKTKPALKGKMEAEGGNFKSKESLTKADEVVLTSNMSVPGGEGETTEEEETPPRNIKREITLYNMDEGTDDDSPQSEPQVPSSWLECSIYQNYTAPEVLVQGLAGVVNQGDVELMVRAQKKMLQRFEKTNEMLTNVNTLSQTRLERATTDFKKHTALVVDMKKDLDSIFKRIRNIKAKLAKQMPEAYNSVGVVEKSGEEDDEYDVMIRERKEVNRAEQAQTSPTLHEEHLGGSLTVSEVDETSTVEGKRSALDERKLEEIQEATEELNI